MLRRVVVSAAARGGALSRRSSPPPPLLRTLCAAPASEAAPAPHTALAPSVQAAGPASTSHEVLGLPPDASELDVKLAYYHLALAYRPDQSGRPDAAERFAEVGRAYSSIMGEPWDDAAGVPSAAPTPAEPALQPASHVPAFPRWVHRLSEYLERVPQRLDLWLMPSYSSVIYHHLRAGELAQALCTFEEMKVEGEVPSHAVYEMLIRGCTIAMRRVGQGEVPDHLTSNMLKVVMRLWKDMHEMERRPDYWTYNELIRAFGKAGAVPQALELFEHMCGNVRLLPEERAFNSMYEMCVLSGNYAAALQVFDEHEELRKSLWKPRYTPVSFSLLLAAVAREGDDLHKRIQQLPRVLALMDRHAVYPRAEACEKLLSACIATREIGLAAEVMSLIERVGQDVDPEIAARARRTIGEGEGGAARSLDEPAVEAKLERRDSSSS